MLTTVPVEKLQASSGRTPGAGGLINHRSSTGWDTESAFPSHRGWGLGGDHRPPSVVPPPAATG